MAKSQLKVSYVVATASDTAWSQTYHAGGVTAVVCVRSKNKENTSPSLSIVGKDLLNTFESEYFTLENKSLASIKEAVSITYQKSRETHDISLLVSAVIQNAVYVVLAGKGKILLIRHNTLATLLEQIDNDDVISASGFLEPDDVMILETPEFAEKIASGTLLETLSTNTVADAAEILSPTVHKNQLGSEAAILFSYTDEGMPMAAPAVPEQKHTEEAAPETEELSVEEPMYEEKKEQQEEPQQFTQPSYKPKRAGITHRQKIFLTIAVIIAVVFIGTIFFSLQNKQTNQNTALFASVYPPAEKKYEEGIGLKDLNASLAQDDFKQAQKMLTDAKGKFPADSTEEKQILALLDKVTAELPSQAASNIPNTDATKATTGDNTFMDFRVSNTSAKYFVQDDTNYYFADATGITRVSKTTKKTTQIIKNDGDWKTLGGFQSYLGNMYVVDTADGIDKYAVTASGFGNKTAYFTSSTPDLSKVVSMAIDGSVWLLASDGTISQYTKGKPVTFTVSGLSIPLSTPSQVITTTDDDNLYILDNGNSRIVAIKKDSGAFVAEYHNDVLKSATQLDVSEKNKTAYILSGGTIYKMTLK